MEVLTFTRCSCIQKKFIIYFTTYVSPCVIIMNSIYWIFSFLCMLLGLWIWYVLLHCMSSFFFFFWKREAWQMFNSHVTMELWSVFWNVPANYYYFNYSENAQTLFELSQEFLLTSLFCLIKASATSYQVKWIFVKGLNFTLYWILIIHILKN